MGIVINTGMRKPTPSYYGRLTADPRELVNWIFGHGEEINFDSATLPQRVIDYLIVLDDFKEYSKKPLKQPSPEIYYVGILFNKAIYCNTKFRHTIAELVNHFDSKTKNIKIRLAN